MELHISARERGVLRELAKKQMEYANLPVMREREGLWRRHNVLKGERPVIAFDTNSFLADLMPPSQCESEAARAMEWELNRWIIDHEFVDDDKVIPDFYTVDMKFDFRQYDLDYHTTRAPDSAGRTLAYHTEKNIVDIETDLVRLKPSVYCFDAEQTGRLADFARETIGDILPVAVKNRNLTWFFGLSNKIISLMGLEDMMIYLYESPDKIHELYEFVTSDAIGYVKWMEREGLLTLNNGNDYAGAGSYGFTDELPKSGDGQTRTVDLWGNINSQETVSVSPQMYHEFCFPYFKRVAELFGLVYYGCCEPVHLIWESSVSRYPNLRKVSISNWSDENIMGEALRGSGVIYSRKPSPNYIGVGKTLDEEAFAAHIAKTLRAAKGCALEILFRDIIMLSGDKSKPGRATQIVRRLIGELW